jgi:hypothetical protein
MKAITTFIIALTVAALWLIARSDTLITENFCKRAETAVIHLRFNDGGRLSTIIEARIGGADDSALELRDARSGALLWSAGATADALLQVPEMDAPILARPVPIDINGDGLDDRIYVADTAGRLWRLDLKPDAELEDWATVRLFADLSGDDTRGFIAAPDVALHVGSDGARWFSIAIGSYSRTPAAENRFYVLRDDAAPTAAAQDNADTPLHEADLWLADSNTFGSFNLANLAQDSAPHGYYLPLGSAQVFASSLTLNGIILFTTAQMPTFTMLPADCAFPASTPATRITVHAIKAQDGTAALDMNTDGHIDADDAALELPGTHAADSAPRIIAPQATEDTLTQLPCLVDEQIIPNCALNLRPQRRYWLREDAD